MEIKSESRTNPAKINTAVLDIHTVPLRGPARPFITVCICTHGRPGYLTGCLEGLRSQTVGLSGFELLVVDSCSPPEDAAELRRLVAGIPNARLIRCDRIGISRARNAGAQAASGTYIAYIDDDAVPAPDWVEQIQRAVSEHGRSVALLGGRTLPDWEAPLPDWWPPSLRGVLSMVEWEGSGEFRTPEVPDRLEPLGANMVVERAAMLEVGGFEERLGRRGNLLLSDEEVHLAWKFQQRGKSVRYDGRVVVRHRIQAWRLTPKWLITRLYWQGVSTVATRRLLGTPDAVWRELPRRIIVRILLAPAGLIPKDSTRLLGLRWRLAYAKGFVNMALGPRYRDMLKPVPAE